MSEMPVVTNALIDDWKNGRVNLGPRFFVCDLCNF